MEISIYRSRKNTQKDGKVNKFLKVRTEMGGLGVVAVGPHSD